MSADDKEQKEFSKRLGTALDHMNIAPDFKGRQREAAALADKGPGSARKWLNGEGYPSMVSMIKLAKQCDVSLEWLATGRGDMLAHTAIFFGQAVALVLVLRPAGVL